MSKLYMIIMLVIIIIIITVITMIIIDMSRENFKWMVDSYRMKWRPSEPNQGQLETEVNDISILIIILFIILIVIILTSASYPNNDGCQHHPYHDHRKISQRTYSS